MIRSNCFLKKEDLLCFNQYCHALNGALAECGKASSAFFKTNLKIANLVRRLTQAMTSSV